MFLWSLIPLILCFRPLLLSLSNSIYILIFNFFVPSTPLIYSFYTLIHYIYQYTKAFYTQIHYVYTLTLCFRRLLLLSLSNPIYIHIFNISFLVFLWNILFHRLKKDFEYIVPQIDLAFESFWLYVEWLLLLLELSLVCIADKILIWKCFIPFSLCIN